MRLLSVLSTGLPVLSRRTFLQVMALSTALLHISSYSQARFGHEDMHTAGRSSDGVQPANPNDVRAAQGKWIRVGDDNYTQVIAVHAALLHTGKILYFSGDETDIEIHNARQQDGKYDYVRLFDCKSHKVLPCPWPTTDIFCAGHAMLADGRMVVAGGIQEGVFTKQEGDDPVQFWQHSLGKSHQDDALGSWSAWLFDPLLQQWSQLTDMSGGPVDPAGAEANPPKTGGRWYPTLLILPSGEILTMSGHTAQDDARHINNTPEILSLATDPAGFWWLMPAAGSANLDEQIYTYPRLFYLPNGKVFSASPLDERHKSHLYDPGSGTLSDLTDAPSDPADDPIHGDHYRLYEGYHGSAVLLPLLPEEEYRPRVLVCGGQQPYVIDLAAPSPQWVPTAPRTLSGLPTRWDLNATLLPTGEVFVSGGINRVGDNRDDIHAVFTPELYNPHSNSWSTLAPATVVRNYHSVALLMPDGRVWNAGSSRNTWLGAAFGERRIEIFEPWYCDPAVQRPQITHAPTHVAVGRQFSLHCPTASTITRVAILRTGSVTHCFDADQRYIGLNFVHRGGDELVVTAPPSTYLALPGYYLLFVLNNEGVPSEGRFMRIPIAPHWARWFRLSEASFLIPPLIVTAVSSVPGGISLFVVDGNGIVQSRYFDPRVADPKWSPWFPLSEPGDVVAGSVVTGVSSVPGGVSLFGVNAEGAVVSSYYDPQVANPQWSSWFPLSGPGLVRAGSMVAAVSTIPGGVSLFVVDPQGGVQSAFYDPRVENPQWSPWFPLGNAGLVRNGAQISAVSSVEGGVSLFVVDPQGGVQSAFYDPRVENPQWSPWFPLSEPGKVAFNAQVTAVSSVPGGISLFVVDPERAVQSAYYDPRVENPQWSAWFRLSEPGELSPTAQLSAVSSVAGGVSLFVINKNLGGVYSAYYDPRVENAQWSTWFRISEDGKAADESYITAVSSIEGGVSLFIVDPEGAIQSTYYDPREGAYEYRVAKSSLTQTLGGTISLPNQRVAATFPAGSLPGDSKVVLMIQDVTSQVTGDRVAIRSFRLEAYASDGSPVSTFALPFALAVDYTDEEIAGLDPDEMYLASWNGTAWTELAIERDDHRLAAQVDYVGEFVLLGSPLPPEPTPEPTPESTPSPQSIHLPMVSGE